MPNAIILLDEISRANADAVNILMTVLDKSQRYLRVDEKVDTETIHVAPGVVFIATANVGSEYTATRILDRALLDRFILFEMKPLDKTSELENLMEMYPSVNSKTLEAIAAIAEYTRKDAETDTPTLNTIISTRMCEEMAGLIQDGFEFEEAAEVCIYSYFDNAGGENSPRSNIKKVVQRFLPSEFDGKADPFRNKGTDDDDQIPWKRN